MPRKSFSSYSSHSSKKMHFSFVPEHAPHFFEAVISGVCSCAAVVIPRGFLPPTPDLPLSRLHGARDHHRCWVSLDENEWQAAQSRCVAEDLTCWRARMGHDPLVPCLVPRVQGGGEGKYSTRRRVLIRYSPPSDRAPLDPMARPRSRRKAVEFCKSFSAFLVWVGGMVLGKALVERPSPGRGPGTTTAPRMAGSTIP